MPKMSISVPHSLGEEEAVARLKKATVKVLEEYQDQAKDVEQTWEGNNLNVRFRTMGMNFKGDIQVAPESVDVGEEIPFAAMLFKSKIEKGIKSELEKLLA